MIKKYILISFVVFIFLNILSSTAFGKTVTIDEATFNKLVNQAQQADVFEREKDFYKISYEEIQEEHKKVTDSYKLEIMAKDALIQAQTDLGEKYKDTINYQDISISLQDKKIQTLQRTNTFKDILVGIGTIAGTVIAVDNDKGGAATGIALSGIAYFFLN